MKKIILLLCVIVPAALAAQNKHFDNFYSKYENREGFACMNITGEMLGSLSMTASENGDGKNEKADTLKDISMIKMVVTETNDREFLKDLDNVISKGDYRNILSVNESGEDKVDIYQYGKDSGTSDGGQKEMLLVINSTDGENVIISVIGEGNLMELVGDLRDCAF